MLLERSLIDALLESLASMGVIPARITLGPFCVNSTRSFCPTVGVVQRVLANAKTEQITLMKKLQVGFAQIETL